MTGRSAFTLMIAVTGWMAQLLGMGHRVRVRSFAQLPLSATKMIVMTMHV